MVTKLKKQKKSYVKLLVTFTLIPLIAFSALSLYLIIDITPKFIHNYQLRAQDNTAVATVESKISDRVPYTGGAKGNSERSYDMAKVSYAVVDPLTEAKNIYTAERAVNTPKKGEKTIVYYDSRDPKDSITEVEVLFTKDYWTKRVVFASITLISTIVMIYVAIQMSRSARRISK